MKYLKQHKKKAHQTGIPKEMPFLIRELKLSRHSKKRMQQLHYECPQLMKCSIVGFACVASTGVSISRIGWVGGWMGGG